MTRDSVDAPAADPATLEIVHQIDWLRGKIDQPDPKLLCVIEELHAVRNLRAVHAPTRRSHALEQVRVREVVVSAARRR